MEPISPSPLTPLTPLTIFKTKLEAGEIQSALDFALGEATQLEIRTWVAQISPLSSSSPSNPLPNPQDQRLLTAINMVEGTVDNEIGSSFLSTGPYTELQSFHFQQVQESSAIIQNYLDSLKVLVEMLTLSDPLLAQPPKAVLPELPLATEFFAPECAPECAPEKVHSSGQESFELFFDVHPRLTA